MNERCEMKTRVFVTGASGFIGRYVVDELVKNQYEVIALVHNVPPCFDKQVKVVKGDMCDEEFVKKVSQSIGKCSIVVHLGADLNMRGDDKTILTNCLGVYHVLQLAASVQAEHFIYLSSIPIIGTPRVLPITEEHPAEPKTLYHVTKWMGEKLTQQFFSEKMHRVILRIPSPIGVGMNKNNYLSFLLRKCIENETIELYGTGGRIQNYIDVRDVAGAVLGSFSALDSGMFLIAGKKEISNRELAYLCREITASSSPIIWGRREDLEENNHWIISSQKALSSFGFLPKYELRETIQWIVDGSLF